MWSIFKAGKGKMKDERVFAPCVIAKQEVSAILKKSTEAILPEFAFWQDCFVPSIMLKLKVPRLAMTQGAKGL